MGSDQYSDVHRIHAELLELIEMKRLLITLSDEAVMIWQAYQVNYHALKGMACLYAKSREA
jgi:hypothetical protein